MRRALCLFALFALSPALALGPFEKNHPLVEEGLAAYQQGDYQAALSKFEAARKELPSSAALEFNRGNALFKLGRFEEAREAYRRVESTDQAELRQQDYYNLGNAWAALGEKEQAIAAYRQALRLDPRDQLARHNLEVLLKKLPPPQQSPDGGSDGGSPDGGGDGGQPDGGRDGGSDGGQRSDGGQDGGSQDAGADGGQTQDGGQDGGRSERDRRDGGQAGGDGGADGGQDGGAAQAELADGGLSKREAEKLLDSMRNNEKNLQLWRFQERKQKRKNEKDW